MNDATYKDLYTRHIAGAPDPNQGVGGGDELLVAQAQVTALSRQGLLQGRRLLELGCGTGRIWTVLKDHVALDSVHYVGLDVVEDLVTLTTQRLRALDLPDEHFRAHVVGDDDGYPTGYDADSVWAFSVFTHMEAEDIVRTLRLLHRCARRGATGLFTFLALEHTFGKVNFEQEMAIPLADRLTRVRNVAYTRDMAEAILRLAGWEPTVSSWGEHPQPYDERGLVQTNQSWICAIRTAGPGES